MAKRKSTRDFARAHESWIAREYRGRVSPSSGASAVDTGDVRTDIELMECKATGHQKAAKSISIKLSTIEKIADEAYAEGLEPAIPLRIYNPDSPLADPSGNVDLICRLVRDDVHRG